MESTSNAYSNVYNVGMHDAVVDGEIIKGIPSRMIFVESDSDLTDAAIEEPVGTIAATYGFGNMWQLGSDGNWVAM